MEDVLVNNRNIEGQFGEILKKIKNQLISNNQTIVEQNNTIIDYIKKRIESDGKILESAIVERDLAASHSA